MSKSNSYYKITDAEALAKIDAFMEKRDQFFEAIRKMCDHYGFDNYSVSESIQNGIRFFGMFAHPKNDTVDITKWKTSKHRSGYLNLEPLATAKEHKAEYLAMKPKSMDYTELNKLILKEGVMPWGSAYGYSYKRGEHFMFDTSLNVSPIAVEILGSEYREISNKAEPVDE